MYNPAQFFADKSLTVMGIDPDGRGLKDTIFLADAGADIVATDLKSRGELQESVEKLAGYENIELVLGQHRLEDFQNKDIIIRPASAPLESKYLNEAKENNISIEIDETLFLKYAPDVTAVGVTGTRGKSTTVHMIERILESTDKRYHIGGNVRGEAMLPKLTEVKEGDIVVMELSSWQLQAFGENKMSPEIAVFTSFFEDHLDYYADDPEDPSSREAGMQRYWQDKSQIYKHQLPDDALIVGAEVVEYIEDTSSFLAVTADDFPVGWKLEVPGEHNRLNAALAVSAARQLDISETDIRKGIESFSAVEGRLEYLDTVNSVDVYNDNNATTEDATAAAIEALKDSKHLTLIAGGSDKKLSFEKLAPKVKNHVDNLILLAGSGTEKMKDAIKKAGGISWDEFDDFESAVAYGFDVTPEGGTLLFSPAAASFNMFANEYERNDTFKNIVYDRL